jgi:hypothetical protein
VSDFFFFAGNDGNDSLWFAVTTPRNGRPDQDGTPLCIAIFGYVDGKNGLTSGRIIKRGSSDFPTCGGTNTTDACITDIARHMRDFGLDTNGDGLDDRPDADTGCGCTWRDTYPPFFSRVVLAHELGHYFGLAHAGHNGFDKIMISTGDGSSVWGGRQLVACMALRRCSVHRRGRRADLALYREEDATRPARAVAGRVPKFVTRMSVAKSGNDVRA